MASPATTSHAQISRGAAAPRQRGAVAIMVGLSLTMLVGFVGLALDLARLYINKSELQTAADACALAAAAELTCPTGANSCLTNALFAGQFAASKNRSDYQATAVTIANADVLVSASYSSGYVSAATAPTTSVYIYSKCIARSAGIVPGFMRAVGPGTANLVTAQAVASLLPAGSGGFCPTAPIAVCPPSGGGSYNVGDWVGANLNGNGAGNNGGIGALKGHYVAGAIKGTFQWTADAGGSTPDLRDQLAGVTTVCGVAGQTVTLNTGNHQGAKDAWNSRLGIYSNGNGGYDVTTAPPDLSGFSYPTRSGDWPTSSSATVPYLQAYADYRIKQSTGTFYQDTSGSTGYSPQGTGNPQVQGSPSTTAQDLASGTSRRLITAAMVNSCAGSTTTAPSYGCFLMLDPMSNGQNGDNFLEYRGPAGMAGSPCSLAGGPGGTAGTGGGVVPTLVQ